MANYVLNDDKMFADIADGVAIVINGETGIYYGFNSFATSVLENIQEDVSSENILAGIKALANAPADIEDKFNALIKSMIDFEIIIVGGNGAGTANINADAAKESEFALDLDAYDDAQELLLADPIHEVKEDEGWAPNKDVLITDKDEVERKEAKVE